MPVHSAASATDTGSPWAATVASGTWTCTTGTGAGDTTGTSHAIKCKRAAVLVYLNLVSRDASHGLVHYIDSPHARVERAVSSQSAGAIILALFCENSPM